MRFKFKNIFLLVGIFSFSFNIVSMESNKKDFTFNGKNYGEINEEEKSFFNNFFKVERKDIKNEFKLSFDAYINLKNILNSKIEKDIIIGNKKIKIIQSSLITIFNNTSIDNSDNLNQVSNSIVANGIYNEYKIDENTINILFEKCKLGQSYLFDYIKDLKTSCFVIKFREKFSKKIEESFEKIEPINNNISNDAIEYYFPNNKNDNSKIALNQLNLFLKKFNVSEKYRLELNKNFENSGALKKALQIEDKKERESFIEGFILKKIEKDKIQKENEKKFNILEEEKLNEKLKKDKKDEEIKKQKEEEFLPLKERLQNIEILKNNLFNNKKNNIDQKKKKEFDGLLNKTNNLDNLNKENLDNLENKLKAFIQSILDKEKNKDNFIKYLRGLNNNISNIFINNFEESQIKKNQKALTKKEEIEKRIQKDKVAIDIYIKEQAIRDEIAKKEKEEVIRIRKIAEDYKNKRQNLIEKNNEEENRDDKILNLNKNFEIKTNGEVFFIGNSETFYPNNYFNDYNEPIGNNNKSTDIVILKK